MLLLKFFPKSWKLDHESYFLLLYAFLQAMMDCLVSPPQPGDESYDTFIKVSACMKSSSLKSFEYRAYKV